MDPITGLVTLAGIGIASLIGLKMSKTSEGFNTNTKTEPLPNNKDKYPESVNTSQTRYNSLTNMINPLINGLIPVGSSSEKVRETRNKMKKALGSQEVSYSASTLNLSNLKNKYIPRADGNDSVFAAIKFCQTTGQQSAPFGIKSADGNFDFNTYCGVCLNGGIDEFGNKFTGQQGMVLDPNTREQGYKEQQQQRLPFARIAPTLGTCQGAPDSPVFATNEKDLKRFGSRLNCMKQKQIDSAHNCGLCFENDTYSYVENPSEVQPITLVVQGVGTAEIFVGGVSVKKFTLSDTSSTSVVLPDGTVEGKIFSINVTANASGNNINIYGYLESTTPNSGAFRMPLNLLLLTDSITGTTPKKAGGFYTFSNVGMEVAKIRPGSSQTLMSLQGTIPFTFVDSDDFSAMDCPAAPYQTKTASVNQFATDQPCYAKGATPGNYSNECLQSIILNAGCTNAGTLYNNPKSLNTDSNGGVQNLTQIYSKLTTIATNDMVDSTMTKQCSGRDITTPCDPFMARSDLSFSSAQGKQCVSYLYNNKGASQIAGTNQTVGSTYTTSGPRYSNNTAEAKKLYCLPQGTLNPDTNPDSLNLLMNLGNNGYKGKGGIEAVKLYLNDQLSLAIDENRNANTDPERAAAIQRCFGSRLNAMNFNKNSVSNPTVVITGVGIMTRYVTVKAGYDYIQIAQLAVYDNNGKNVALNKPTTSSGVYDTIDNNPDSSYAVDGKMANRPYPDIYHSAGGEGSFWTVDLGKEYDITRIVYYNRSDCCDSRSQGMKIELLNSSRTVVGNATISAGKGPQTFNFLSCSNAQPDYEKYVDNYGDLLNCFNTKCWTSNTGTKAQFGKTHYNMYGKKEQRNLPMKC